LSKKKKIDTAEPLKGSDKVPARDGALPTATSPVVSLNGHDGSHLVIPAVAPYPRHALQQPGLPPTLHGLRRHWPQIIGAGLVCAAGLASAAWFYYQPKFHAYASLRVHSETPRLAFAVQETEQASQFEVFKRTQRELVLGDDVLLSALMDKKITGAPLLKAVSENDDPVTWLRKQLRVEFPGDAEIMSVSMDGDNAIFITDAVNSVVDAYVQNVVNAGKQHRSDRLAELRKVLSDQEEKARRLRSKLQTLTESLGSGDTGALSVKQQAAIQRFAQLQTQHGQVQFERLRAELKVARIADQLQLPTQSVNGSGKNAAGPAGDMQTAAVGPVVGQLQVKGPSPEQLDYLVQKDPAVAKQQEILQQANASLERQKGLVRDGQDALLEPYRSRIAHEQQILQGLKDAVRTELRSRVVDEQAIAEQKHRADLANRYAEAESELKVLQVQEKLLGDKLSEATVSSDNIGTNSVNVELTRKELERVEGIYNSISNEIETLTIELSSAARVEALSRAREPKARTQQDRTKKAFAFGMLGFLLPCAGLLWLDSRRKLINGETELQQLPLRLLGSVPIVRRLNHRKQDAKRDALALREAVDRIRTVLLREADVSDYRVVQITSSIAGEGKTTFACQLARSLARAHRATVLVDFDLRRPAVHEVFGISLDKGLCDLLRSTATVDQVLRSIDHETLSVITAGRCDSDALEGLTKNVVDEIVSGLRERFEFVVVDSSPVLPVVDALLVAQQCDATILTALRDKSRVPQLLEAEGRLHQIGVNVLGSVVTTKSNSSYGQHLDRYASA
jgi:polysaccharide biosynthesis transport protein